MATKNKQFSKNKKGKYVEFERDIIKPSLSTQNSSQSKNIYETPIQTLSRLFPQYDTDILETLFEENYRNFHRTKMCIEKMNESHPVDPSENHHKEEIVNENNEKQNVCPHKYLNFKYDFDFDSTFIEEKQKEIKIGQENKEDNKTMIENQEKEDKENKLVVSDRYTPVLTNFTQNNHYYKPESKSSQLEEYMLDDYIVIILEIFPDFNRIDILQTICEFDFDIDRVILFLLDEKLAKTMNFENLASSEISQDCLEGFINNIFDKKGNDKRNISETISKHNLQKQIENRILSENNDKKNNIQNIKYDEVNFPSLCNKQTSSDKNFDNTLEEDFLDKDILKIKNGKIRNDLLNLKKLFPLIEEFTIKWVYYQFMDFKESKKYLLQQSTLVTNTFEQKSSSKCEMANEQFIEIKRKDRESQSKGKENLVSELYNIISNKPVSWKIEETNSCDLNLNNYKEIRRNRILYARRAWALGRHQDARVIMAKANRYKIEFSNLIEKRKLNIFTRNNQYNINCSSEANIDLHGLNYEESKILIKKKILDIKSEISKGNIQKFSLNIITGVGNHSNNFEPVLLPKLTSYLKEQGYKIKINKEQGNIKVLI